MQERRVVKPGLLLGMVWGVVLLFTMYGPDVIRDASEKSDFLREQAWLQSTLAGFEKAGQAVGLAALRDELTGVRNRINAPYTVLAYEEPEAPIEPPPPALPPPPAAPDALAHVAPKRPRRVLVIGASSIQFAIGVELERRMPTYEGVKVKRFGQLATGLSRPDFFDWPKKLETLAKSFKPDLVIANYGGNGAQGIMVDGKKVPFKTPEWDVAYGDKVREMVDIARAHGADMVFMGMPTMRKKAFTNKMRYLNRVQGEAARAAGAMFVSTFEMAANPDGSYRKSITFKGKRGLMRTSDGVHYRKLGAKYVVEQVLQAVERRFRLVPPDLALAVAEGHAFVSEVSSSTVAYTAYVPRGATAQAARPAVLVLPGAKDDWHTWPKYPHRALQAEAERRGQVLVVPEAGADLSTEGALGELKRDLVARLPVSELASVIGSQDAAPATLDPALELREARTEAGSLTSKLTALLDGLAP